MVILKRQGLQHLIQKIHKTNNIRYPHHQEPRESTCMASLEWEHVENNETMSVNQTTQNTAVNLCSLGACSLLQSNPSLTTQLSHELH